MTEQSYFHPTMVEISDYYSTDKYQPSSIYSNCALIDPKIQTDPICCNYEMSGYNYSGNYNKNNFYDKFVSKIHKKGTISPSGPLIEPKNNIKIKLKKHQQRSLYEMISREDYKYRLNDGPNILMYCDNVGSGKSITILSLIAERPLVKSTWENKFYLPKRPVQGKINTASVVKAWNDMYTPSNYFMSGFEYKNISIFNSNLMIIPHNIFNQWTNYIDNNTTLKSFTIGNRKQMRISRKEMYVKLNEVHIVIIKSTMFKDFINIMDTYFGRTNIVADKSHVYYDSMLDKRKESIMECKSNVEVGSVGYEEDKPKYYIPGTNLDDKKFLGNNSGYMFQRVIVDEVDSITIPNFPYVMGKYIWFITSSVYNIMFPAGKWSTYSTTSTAKKLSSGISGTGFLKNMLMNSTHHRYSEPYVSSKNTMRVFKTIIRNNNDFIKDNMTIPEMTKNYISCFTPSSIYAVSDAIDKKALQALNAGDIKTAIKYLGCDTGTEDDLLNIVSKNLKVESAKIKEKISELDKKINEELNKNEIIKLLISDSEREMGKNDELVGDLKAEEIEINLKVKKAIENINKSKDEWTAKLNQNSNKLNGIKERVSNSENKDCGICASKMERPSVTPCCHNLFCINCITTALQYSKECPFCRHPINIKDINVIVNSGSTINSDKSDRLPTKIEKLCQIISDKSKRFMIFSEYDATFNEISEKLNKDQIKYSLLKGSSGRINNIISKFTNRDINVLLLNSKNFGAGLNLQITDEIIIYHRMSTDLENQVIGRAQRMGRENPLVINYLCYETEIQS